MFDTFQGLPVHVLVVHAVVVLVPLSALATGVVALVPRLRRRAAWQVVVADAACVLLVVVATQSGRALQARIGTSAQIQRHVQRGELMVWFVLLLLVAAVLVALARNAASPIPTIVGMLSVLAAGATLYWVVRTAEAGTSAVWRDVIANTTPG